MFFLFNFFHRIGDICGIGHKEISYSLGPGDSLRSHTANEFVYVNEIKDGINKYILLIEEYNSLI